MNMVHAAAAHARGILKGAFLGLLGAALVVMIASAIVWPLWYLATVHTTIYAILMLIAIACGLAYFAYARIRRSRADSSGVHIGQ